jgi:hypothetical protein
MLLLVALLPFLQEIGLSQKMRWNECLPLSGSGGLAAASKAIALPQAAQSLHSPSACCNIIFLSFLLINFYRHRL